MACLYKQIPCGSRSDELFLFFRLRACLHGVEDPSLVGWFLLFSRSGGHKTKETYPTRPGSPTPCKQALRCYYCYEKEKVKKAIGWISKTKTRLHVHHAFLYISLPSLRDYDGKMPNFTFHRGHNQPTAKFSFSFWTWMWFLGIRLKKSALAFDKVNEFEWSR